MIEKLINAARRVADGLFSFLDHRKALSEIKVLKQELAAQKHRADCLEDQCRALGEIVVELGWQSRR